MSLQQQDHAEPPERIRGVVAGAGGEEQHLRGVRHDSGLAQVQAEAARNVNGE